MSFLERFADRGRVAVVRALQLGDLLCAVPALRALRAALPNHEITLVGLPWAKEFPRRFSAYVDDFLEFPGFPGLPERRLGEVNFAAWLNAARERRFDLAIQLHGSGAWINPFTQLLRARHVAGFYEPGTAPPRVESFLPWPETGHEIERLLALPKFLGAPDVGLHLEFPLLAEDREEFEKLCKQHDLRPREYVCLHPGGRMNTRRWSLAKYAALGRELMAKRRRVVVTGAAFEKPLADPLAEALGPECVNLAGRTSLGGLGAVIESARLLVSNDTAVSHFATAFQTPSVLIVLGSEPSRWAPLDRERHRRVSASVPCRPCFHLVCPTGFECERDLDVATVSECVERTLAESSRAGRPGPAKESLVMESPVVL